MWFTDSDKVLWTLVMCIFINIVGFTFMEDFFKIITPIASAGLALFFKHIYDTIQEKKRLKRLKVIIVDVLENIYIKTLNSILEDYEEILRIISLKEKVSTFPKTITFPIEAPIVEYFGKTDMIKIVLKLQNIDFSEVHTADLQVNNIIKYSPSHIFNEMKQALIGVNKTTEINIDKTPHKVIEINKKDKELKDKLIEATQYNLDIRINELKDVLSFYERFITELKK